MDRLAYVVAVYAAAVGLLCAQQPDGATPTPNPPKPAAATAATAPAETERTAKPGNGLGAERARHHEPGQGGKQAVPEAFMERLRQEHPELHKRLSKLYQEDREKFFQEVRTLMREREPQVPETTSSSKRSQRSSAEEQKCLDLSRSYQECTNAAEKERLKTELAAAVQAAYEAKLRGSQERIARLEQQLKEFRGRLERMEANRDKICTERLDELTRPTDLRWNSHW